MFYGAAQKGRFGIASMNVTEDCGGIQTLSTSQKTMYEAISYIVFCFGFLNSG